MENTFYKKLVKLSGDEYTTEDEAISQAMLAYPSHTVRLFRELAKGNVHPDTTDWFATMVNIELDAIVGEENESV